MERIGGEKPNDRNDRAIRVAAAWYENHLSQSQKDLNPDQRLRVVILTEDAANRDLAKRDGILACSGSCYCKAIFTYLDLCISDSEKENSMLLSCVSKIK